VKTLNALISARNILLLSWLLDETTIDDAQTTHHWSAFYSVVVKPECFQEIHDRSSLLHQFSADLETWHSCKYGDVLRFTDAKSLHQVRRIWAKYSNFPAPGSAPHRKFRDDFMKQVGRIHKEKLQGGFSVSGVRSAGINSIAALVVISESFGRFWKTGVAGGLPELTENATCLNPLLVFSEAGGDRCSIHYGADPLLGFHCSTAFVEMSPVESSKFSPDQYRQSEDREISIRRFVKTAMEQFKAWCISFQSAAVEARRASGEKSLIVHHFCGDALEFSFSAQTAMRRMEPKSNIFNSCRAPWKDSLEFLEDATFLGPFDVIDTSNISDHVGPMHVLIGCLPLLKHSANSTLYTDHLVQDSKDSRPIDRLKSLLCGDPTSIFVLLRAAPMECLTGITSVSSFLEETYRTFFPAANGVSQSRWRLAWKDIRFCDPNASSLLSDRYPCSWDDEALARLLVAIYHEMFKEEEIATAMESLAKKYVMPRHYTRSGFVALLSLIQRRHQVKDWTKLYETFVGVISQHDPLSLKTNAAQDLFLQLHLQGLYTCGIMRTFVPRNPPRGWPCPLPFPPTLGLLFRVPFGKCLPVLSECRKKTLSLVFEVYVDSPPFSNRYGSIHCAYAHQIPPSELPEAWRDCSDLIVYVHVASWTIVSNSSTASKISLRLRHDIASLQTFGLSLGPYLTIFETNLHNSVYVVPKFPHDPLGGNVSANSSATIERPECSILVPNMSIVNGQITATTRAFLKGDPKARLAKGAPVTNVQTSASILTISLGTLKLPLPVPFPFQHGNCTVRIARKSGWIEAVVPFTTNTSPASFNVDPFSIIREKSLTPYSWTMPRVIPKGLPVVQLSTDNNLGWIRDHVMSSFSNRERALRDDNFNTRTTGDGFVDLKEELFIIILRAAGLQDPSPHKIFLLETPSMGVCCVIFVKHVKLEESYATLAADAYVLVLTPDLVHRFSRELLDLNEGGAIQIKCSEESYKVWGRYLAASIERCRDWVHTKRCATAGYKTHEDDTNQPLLRWICRCGAGKVPQEFREEKRWKPFSPFVVRCLLTPVFPAPSMELQIPESMLGNFKKDMDAHIDDERDEKAKEKDSLKELRCSTCKAAGRRDGGKLLRCSGCSQAVYCSKECQRNDWKDHRKRCGKWGKK
jgi:MYND finger